MKASAYHLKLCTGTMAFRSDTALRRVMVNLRNASESEHRKSNLKHTEEASLAAASMSGYSHSQSHARHKSH